MGGKTSTSSASSGGGGGSSNNNNNNNQAAQIAKQVKKDIGLVEKKAGPFDYLQKGATTGYYASAYAGTPEADFYGGKASTAAKKRMEEAGMGTYNAQNDSFQNVVGNQIISSTGMMGTSMGSGENTIMGQVPISKAMFEQQRKLKMMTLLPLSLLAPFPVSSVLGYAAGKARQEQYSNYVNNFNNQIKTSTSYASSLKNQTSEPSQPSPLDQATAEEGANTKRISAEIERQKQLALSRKAVQAAAKRKFFGGKTRVIEGRMVGGL
jgi:hypothetical protein